MSGWVSWDWRCGSCSHEFIESIKRSENRDAGVDCVMCDGNAKYFMTPPNVSTTKLSRTMPEVLAQGRFNEERAKQKLKKLRSSAKKSGDMKQAKAITKELKNRS